jgi:hypothetical protein
VAEEMGLPDDWLNDAVKGFLPGADPSAVPLPEIEGIEVTTASARYLLALKLMAMRIGEDDEDIEMLLREAGIDRTDDALDLLEHIFSGREPPQKTRLFLEELLGPASRG